MHGEYKISNGRSAVQLQSNRSCNHRISLTEDVGLYQQMSFCVPHRLLLFSLMLSDSPIRMLTPFDVTVPSLELNKLCAWRHNMPPPPASLTIISCKYENRQRLQFTTEFAKTRTTTTRKISIALFYQVCADTVKAKQSTAECK